ncbi:MAG: glycosyltransferase [Candidatus Gracilibacteria bacterium]|nr:glycosyltransferase [Candidatus Gracilibacteria bacterium]
MPKISIITTTYRHEKFIAQTIESVLSQTFTDWELLIGDDSPDDATWNIIQNYTEKYPEKIKAWHHSPNKGIVGNMNFLLEKVSLESEYIAFLEGDDMYTPDNLEKRLAIFREMPEVMLVYPQVSLIDAGGNITQKNLYPKPPIPSCEIQGVYFTCFENGSMIFSYSSGMVRRNILNECRIRNLGDEKNYSVSDWDFYFQCVTRYLVYYLDESLVHYRQHSTNLSRGTTNIGTDYLQLIDAYFRMGILQKGKTLIYCLNPYISVRFILRAKILLVIFLPMPIVLYIFKIAYFLFGKKYNA